MRILVCGGRDFDDWTFLHDVMYDICFEIGKSPKDLTIIHGAAKGADTLAGHFARSYDIPQDIYPADWLNEGKRAGYLRNAKMLSEGKPDLVVAFPGGNGTAMMVRLARKAGVTVKEITYGND